MLNGGLWMVLGVLGGLPLNRTRGSRIAGVNGLAMFGALLAALCLLVLLLMYTGHPDTAQWWFWV